MIVDGLVACAHAAQKPTRNNGHRRLQVSRPTNAGPSLYVRHSSTRISSCGKPASATCSWISTTPLSTATSCALPTMSKSFAVVPTLHQRSAMHLDGPLVGNKTCGDTSKYMLPRSTDCLEAAPPYVGDFGHMSHSM